MAKNSVDEWDRIAANNSDVGGIDIVEGCPSSNIHGALREIMAQVAAHDPVAEERRFDTVPDLMADGSMGYAASAAAPVASGDFVSTRDGPYAYKVVASTATEYHVATAGGVKLLVLPGASGAADIRAFGATGKASDDQDAAVVAAALSDLPITIPADFIVTYNTPLALRAPWVGAGKGQGLPGSATDITTTFETSELRFTGTGWAITTRAPFQHIALRADTSVAGQSGIKFLGAGIGQIAGPVRVMEFDATGIEVGGAVEQSGIFFANLSALEVNNNDRLGTLGLHVIGGGASSANANIITGCFVSGPWETYLKVQGNNNTFLNADVNPKPSDVIARGATIDAGVIIEGDGNTFINPYFEPTPGQGDQYTCLVRFSATASSNRIERMYSPSAGNKVAGLIEDLGTANEVTLAAIGENYTPSVGVARSEDNLIPNPGFVSPDANTIPDGWVIGGGSTGTITVDTTITRRTARTLKISTDDNRAQAVCFLLSAANLSVRNAPFYYPADMFAKQTLSAGVWCKSDTPGLGAIKVSNGTSTLGAAAHSGSGEWEFLTVRTRAVDTPAEVTMALRNSSTFANTTGECFFSEPVFVLGADVPRYGGTRKMDAEKAVMFGSFSWNKPRDLAPNEATPSVAEGSLFNEANSLATTITNFDDGREGQEIILTVTSANTTLANNANIKTTTGANKPLSADRAYRLVRANGAWWEV